MKKKINYIITVLKVFSSFGITVIFLFILAESLLGLQADWWSLIIYSLVFSFTNAFHYIQTTMEISLEDKENLVEDLRERLEHSRWKVISETKDAFIVEPKFNRPYSWIYKERVMIAITENHAQLTGAKTYVNKIKDIIDNKRSIWDKKSVRYLANLILMLMILIPSLMYLGVMDRIALKKTYHEYKIKNIEKISFEENLILGNTENNINNYGQVVAKEGDVFYVKDHSHIYRTDEIFNNETNIIKESSGQGLWYLNVVEDWLFYREGKAIKRIKIDGSQQDTIFNLGYTLDLHLLDNWLYFRYFSDNLKVYKMTINGEELQKIIDIPVSDIAIYDNKLYYSYFLDGRGYLKSMDLNSDEEELIANLHVRDMILEDDRIYYIDDDDNKLYQYDLLKKQLKLLMEEEITKFLKAEEEIYFMGKGEDGFHPGKGLYKINLKNNSKEMIHDNWFMDKIGIIDDWILYKSSTKDKQPPTLKRIHKKGSTVIEMDSGL